MLTPVLLMCVCHVRILWGVGFALIMLTITIISSNMILEVIMLVELLSRRSVLFSSRVLCKSSIMQAVRFVRGRSCLEHWRLFKKNPSLVP